MSIKFASIIKRSRLLAGFCLLAIFTQYSDSVWAQSDSITVINGRPVRGAVKQFTPDSITVSTSDSEVNVDPWNIRRIKFDDEPNELTRAKSGFADDRFNVCLEELNRITEDPTREVIQHEIDYFRAMASARTALAGGEITASQAAKLINDFVRDHPESYHLIPASDALGDLAMAVGRFDVAAQQYQLVSQSKWPELSFQAILKSGRAAMMQGKYDEAISAFSQVEEADRAEDYALQFKLIAKCLRAQALGLSGQPDQGIQVSEEIIKNESSDNEIVFAHAYNARGACYKQKQELKRAAQAYLHTDLLFFTASEAHAEALYELQHLWSQLNESDMANEARQKLKNRYRNTYWASKDG